MDWQLSDQDGELPQEWSVLLFLQQVWALLHWTCDTVNYYYCCAAIITNTSILLQLILLLYWSSSSIWRSSSLDLRELSDQDGELLQEWSRLLFLQQVWELPRWTYYKMDYYYCCAAIITNTSILLLLILLLYWSSSSNWRNSSLDLRQLSDQDGELLQEWSRLLFLQQVWALLHWTYEEINYFYWCAAIITTTTSILLILILLLYWSSSSNWRNSSLDLRQLSDQDGEIPQELSALLFLQLVWALPR